MRLVAVATLALLACQAPPSGTVMDLDPELEVETSVAPTLDCADPWAQLEVADAVDLSQASPRAVLEVVGHGDVCALGSDRPWLSCTSPAGTAFGVVESAEIEIEARPPYQPGDLGHCVLQTSAGWRVITAEIL